MLREKKQKFFFPNDAAPFIKTTIICLFFFMALVSTSGCTDHSEKTIKVSGAFALYPMMGIWSEEYRSLHPDIKIDISAGGAGKGMSDAIKSLVDIGMVSREIYQSEIDQGIFWVSVCKDAVVATINEDNPVYESLNHTGLTRQQFIDIFITRTISTWGELINDTQNTNKINVYTRADSCGAAETWAKYLGNYTQNDLTNAADAAIDGDPNLAAVVQGDIYGIGYNNINFIYDGTTQQPYEGIRPIPIDLNANGVLDGNEQVYEKLGDIVYAIANDVYPSPPARALHLVTKQNFSGITKDFVYWILTDGQQYIPDNGYIQLSPDMIDLQITYMETGSRPEIP
ncbi:MAG: PstS family phosphate ABC transporter substrate-binding protein [Thermoplasmatota archaeon]